MADQFIEWPDHVKVCDCARCGSLLLSRTDPGSVKWWEALATEDRKLVPLVATRVADRPVCKRCLDRAINRVLRARSGKRPDREGEEATPSQEGAIKNWEDMG